MSTVQGPNFDFYSVPEAAVVLGVTDGRVRQMLAANEIQGQKLGQKAWAIPRAEVERVAQIPKTTGRPRSGMARA